MGIIIHIRKMRLGGPSLFFPESLAHNNVRGYFQSAVTSGFVFWPTKSCFSNVHDDPDVKILGRPSS